VPLNVLTGDLAFRSDGVLFGLYGGGLFTVNTLTGVATSVGPLTTGGGFAFAGSTLYLADSTNLYTVNQPPLL